MQKEGKAKRLIQTQNLAWISGKLVKKIKI